MKNLIALIFLGIIGKCSGLGKECVENPCTVNDKSIRFFVIGDWGGIENPPYVTKGQQKCATFLQDMGPTKKPQFFVSTGDNFYSHGVTSVDDPRFRDTFEDVFQYGRDPAIPWYMLAGNRDWFGNVSAQIEYTQRSNRWVYPYYAYSTQFDARPQGPSVDMIFIDTIILCGNTPDNKTDGPEYLPGPEDTTWSESLWGWIEEQLMNSTADYLFVVGHYPAFASDRHNINECLVPRLLALMEKYNVTAYVSGHSHTLQHITTVSPTNRTIHHVISGVGHSAESIFQPFNLTDNPWQLQSQFFFPKASDGIKKRNQAGGLVYTELGAKSGSMEYYNCDGTHLYGFQFEPRPL